MLGFVAAVAAELATGRTVAEQVKISPGPIAAVFALFSVASLIPILKVCCCNSYNVAWRKLIWQRLWCTLLYFAAYNVAHALLSVPSHVACALGVLHVPYLKLSCECLLFACIVCRAPRGRVARTGRSASLPSRPMPRSCSAAQPCSASLASLSRSTSRAAPSSKFHTLMNERSGLGGVLSCDRAGTGIVLCVSSFQLVCDTYSWPFLGNVSRL